jgi:hypothetical protein
MSTQIQRRRGTTAQHSTFTGAVGEVTVDTDKEVLVVHDGAQAGGYPQMRENGSNSALALGSAATPSLKFSGDTNTGIYSPGADQVAISTNGTARLRVGSDGTILAGTASAFGQGGLTISPAYSQGSATLAFNRANTTNTSIPAYFQNNDANVGWLAYSNNTVGIIGASGTSVVFGTNSAEVARFDSSGRLGLGTSSPNELLEVTGNIHMSGAADRTIFNRANNALSLGTNNTARLHITNAGNVGIGTTPNADSRLHVKSGANDSNPVLRLEAATNNFLNFRQTGSVYDIHVTAGDPLSFTIGASERARIDGSGRLLVGTSTHSGLNVTSYTGLNAYFANTGDTGISLSRFQNTTNGPSVQLLKSRGTSVGSLTTVSSGDSLGEVVFAGADGDEFRAGASIQAIVDGTPGNNDMPGRLVFSTTADGASSPTERMRITNGGNVFINKTVYDTATPGIRIDAGGSTAITMAANTVLLLNRTTNDGTVVNILQDDVSEGTISVSGTTVSYNGAHLSRWSQLPGGVERTEILRGTVLSNIDEMCAWGDEENEQLNRMKVSDIEGDPDVSGVFQAWDDDDDTYTDDFYCAMTGDFIIRIAEGITVQRGDLLMSAGDGTAKPQDDDIIRSKTIAKVTSTHVTCTYDDGSYCVPCVLMAC